MPITWKNVENAGGFVAGARLTESASTSFNAGMRNFSDILAKGQKVSDDNRVNTIDNNDSAYKDILASYATPEALAAAKASGEVDQKLAALGPLINKDLAREGFGDRLREVRTDANAERTYNDGLAMATAKPLREQYLALKLSNRDAEAAAFLSANQGAFDAAGMTGDLQGQGNSQDRLEVSDSRSAFAHGRTVLEAGRSDTRYAREQKQIASEDAADALIATTFQQQQEADVAAGSEANALAISTGVPELAGSPGVPDWSRATPDQRAAFETQAGNLKAGMKTDTQILQDTLSTYRSSPDFSIAGYTRLSENLNVQLAAKNNIAPADMAERTRVEAQLGTQYDIASNSLINGKSTDPAADSRIAVNEIATKEDSPLAEVMANQGNAQMVYGEVEDALMNGVEYKGKTYPMTKEMVASALDQVRENGWLPGANFSGKDINTLLVDYVRSPGYIKQYDNATAYKTKLADLQAGYGPESGINSPNGLDAATARFKSTIPAPTPAPVVQENPAPAPVSPVLQGEVAPQAAAGQRTAADYPNAPGDTANLIAALSNANTNFDAARAEGRATKVETRKTEWAQEATAAAEQGKLWDMNTAQLEAVLDDGRLSKEVETQVRAELLKSTRRRR